MGLVNYDNTYLHHLFSHVISSCVPATPKPRRPARDEANGRIIAAFSTKTAFTFTTSTTTVPYTCISGALPTAVCTKRRLRRTVPIGDLRAGAEYVLLLFSPSLIFSFYLFSFLFVFFFDFSFYLFSRFLPLSYVFHLYYFNVIQVST